jgi:hypothetical protein
MNSEQINEIIANYDKLLALAESKVKLLATLDGEFYGAGTGIVEISFDEIKGKRDVCVQCNDSRYGCSDYVYFRFPIEWLSKTDAELSEIVLNQVELKAEKARAEKERIEKIAAQRDHEEYQRLKAKFEPGLLSEQ